MFKLKPQENERICPGIRHIPGQILSFAGVLYVGQRLLNLIHKPISPSFTLYISVTDCTEDFVR